MKTTAIMLSGLLATAAINPAFAGASMEASTDPGLDAKKAVSFVGATTAGVALAGPLGLLGGTLLAVWMHDTLDTAASAESSQRSLEVTQADLAVTKTVLRSTEQSLAEARASSAEYAQLVLDQLQLEMLFKTGASELTNTGQMRLAALARFLKANPMIAIRLDGYADPRGNADFNKALSESRVGHVASLLSDYGVDTSRIQQYSHGDSQSVAATGDVDAYALERAVRIELTPSTKSGIASTQ